MTDVSTTAPLRIGLVGCGRLAELGYLPAFARARRARLVAVADPDGPRREAAGAAAGCLAVASCHDLLDAGVDAVVLATPASAHVADAELAARAGAAVLVEKPPAPDAAGAARLAELGPAVRVGFNRRFDRGLQQLRARVPAGQPVHLTLAITYRRASWSAHAVRDDVLVDLGPHLVDQARWLGGGEVLEVTATELTADRARLELRLDRPGVTATVTVAADRLHAERSDIRDTSGRVVARHRTGGPVAAVTGRVRRNRPHPLVTTLAAQLDAFAAAARGEPSPLLGTAADGVAVMQVVDAARASAAGGGRPTPVPQRREATTC